MRFKRSGVLNMTENIPEPVEFGPRPRVVVPDVARQDAARAYLGLGQRERALEHLRLASRVSPPARRAFHLWTLGTVLYLTGRNKEAAGALGRAARWGTTDKPLYLAQEALARRAAGERGALAGS